MKTKLEYLVALFGPRNRSYMSACLNSSVVNGITGIRSNLLIITDTYEYEHANSLDVCQHLHLFIGYYLIQCETKPRRQCQM